MFVASQRYHAIRAKALQNLPPTLGSAASDNETVLSYEAHLETLTRLVDTKSDLAFLDAEITKFLDVLREPMALRKRLNSRILDYHAATSPQRKLPNEILSLIFAYCVTEPIHVPVTFKEAPWNTSHVCSRWRQVSIAQRDLWKNIFIYFDVFLLRRWNSHFACGSMMEELLRRSSGKLISLSFAVSNGGPIKIDFDQVSNYIVDHAHRIQKLSICDEDCSDRELPRDAFDFFKNVSFSALESLVVDIPIRNLPWPIQCPQLSHLEIDDRSQGFDFTALRLLLEKCSRSLLTLNLRIPTPRGMQLFGVSIIFPRLQAFVLFLENNDVLEGNSRLLLAFILPSLTRLVIYDDDSEGVPWEPHFERLITRKFDTIQSLHIGISVPIGEFDGLLAGLPNLVELILPYGNVIADSTLSSLARGGVVPKLSRLMCEATGSLEPHVDMLETRTSMTNPASDMKDVVLIFDCREDEIVGIREAHHARVAKLREKGITLSLVCWGEEDVAGFAKGYRPA